MEDMGAYYPPSHDPQSQYPYYQPPPPPPPGALHPPPPPPQHQLTVSYVPQLQPSHLYVPAIYQHSPQDQVRTLFVAGLPEDVKPREIYNLFREFPGYESSHLRSATNNTQPFGFAVFSDQKYAVAAMHALNGMVFDLERGSTLYVDLAKSNSRSKRPRIDEDRTGSDKKFKGSASVLAGSPDTGVGSVHIPGMGNSAYNTIGYPPAPSQGNFTGRTTSDSSAKLNATQNPPCPTLFVANLGPSCTEQELTQLFSRCPGFLKLKIQSTYGAPVAFVDFQDTNCSTGALNHLQGTILYSSPTGDGMRLEYARSRMGMRKKSK